MDRGVSDPARRFPVATFPWAATVLLLVTALPAGATEFQVNAYTTGAQTFPSVAVDDDGRYVVVWYGDGPDGSGVFGRRYDSSGSTLGTEFQISSGADPEVASDSEGDFIVVWLGQSGGDIGVVGRRYASSGAALGTEFLVQPSTTGLVHPSVAADSDGDLVVVWMSYFPDNVFARRYASGGAAVGTEFQVNSSSTTYSPNYYFSPSVAADSDGDFVVVWTRFEYAIVPMFRIIGSSVFGRRYASSGAALGSDFDVSGVCFSCFGQAPSVAADSDGNFVVAFEKSDNSLFPDPRRLFASRFDSTGSLLENFQVNSAAVGGSYNSLYVFPKPQVAIGTAGDFVIVWQLSYSPEDPADDSPSVLARSFSSAGDPTGPEFQVNEYTTGYQGRPDVAARSIYDFMIVWSSDEQDGSDEGVFAQGPALTPQPPTPTPTATPLPLCPATPQMGCRTAGKSLLKITNKSDNAKDKLLWKWINGLATMPSEFGNPTSTTDTALCVYDNGARVLSAVIPPSNIWRAFSAGYKYKDAAAATAGVKKVILKGSTSAKSKIVMSGKGANLVLPMPMLTGPVTAQLVNSDTIVCFTATYAAEQIDSSAESFKGKAP